MKASAAVPDAPEKPLDPIHVVLPEIPVMPAKQGFLDKLVAGKSEAEKEAERLAEEARKAEEEQRRLDEEARKAEEAARKEAEKARKEAEEVRREQQQADDKARAKADDAARKEAEKAREKADKDRRAREKARRRAEERARRAADADADEDDDDLDDEDYDDFDEDFDEPVAPRGYAGPTAPPRPGPAPAPTRPGPGPAPARPGTRPGPGGTRPYPPSAPAGRPQRSPDRRFDDRRQDDRYGYDDRRRGPAPAPRRSRWRWVAIAGALIALGGGSAAVANSMAPAEAVGFKPGLDLGKSVPILNAVPGSLPMPSAAGLDSALAPVLADYRLGTPAMTVVDAATGKTLWDVRGEDAVIPASAQKLLTAAAVLSTRGPNYRIPTQVVKGSGGDIVIVGNGDPTLARGQNGRYDGAAHMQDLADQVRQALGGALPDRILVDVTAFQPPTVGPYTEADITGENQVSYITALMTDGGLVNALSTSGAPERQSQPHIAAAKAFAAALGVPNAEVVEGSAPSGAEVLGEVLSPPISRIVEQMLQDSDNTLAEMMAHQVAIAKGMPASFEGGAAATKAALEGIGIATPPGLGLVDGSGLSYGNKVSVTQLATVLSKAASGQYPQLTSILSGLPVAGYSGTLDQAHNRDLGSGRGYVRAKTGTLSGVNSLAGTAVDAQGRLLIFVVIANNTPSRDPAQRMLDKIGEIVAKCGCA